MSSTIPQPDRQEAYAETDGSGMAYARYAQRVQLAREYLTGAQKRKVDQLPPSVMMRDLAETRRLLGQVLEAVNHQAPVLTEAQRATILGALAVASEYKRDRAASCSECDASPAELCGTCEWRLARADEYDTLAREIGGQR